MDFDGLDFDMSLKITKGTKVFGPGIVALLENVERYESLNKATMQMGMAYSKAWKIVKAAESKLGVPLLKRRIGGSGGGGAVLTAEGKYLLETYQGFVKEANVEVAKVFKKYFGGKS